MSTDTNTTILTFTTHHHHPPFLDQKPGTSGLRKRVKVFQQPHYTESFIQSIFHVILSSKNKEEVKVKVKDKDKDKEDITTTTSTSSSTTLVVGGDGRFFLKEAIQKIIAIALALASSSSSSSSTKVDTLIIGQNGILSTPAASHLIRKHKAIGGILLTASHNPGGPENDFGIKFNTSNGGPAPESITDQIYQISKTLTSYQMANIPEVPLDQIQVLQLSPSFKVHIIDPVADYVCLMKSIFDFNSIKKMLQDRPNFKVLFDAMHGVTGPYARQIFITELGLPPTSVMRDTPLPDFGGGHPDPNLTYAQDLVTKVNLHNIDLGAASDGDGDRNMVVGPDHTFVNPCDSVAVIAAWAARCIPYFQANPLKGVARSMPTSRALDRVASALGVPAFEVPTGWKFFGRLMDTSRASLCGEESFGTGSDHVREKDGVWAVLAWLSILSHCHHHHHHHQGEAVAVRHVLVQHYRRFGRHYFMRYDFDDVDAGKANAFMAHVQGRVATTMWPWGRHGAWTVQRAGEFVYTDPVDEEVVVAGGQGLFVEFQEHEARWVVRLSGTGAGAHTATVRMYFETYEPTEIDLAPHVALKALIDVVFEVTEFVKFIGTDKPTVVT